MCINVAKYFEMTDFCVFYLYYRKKDEDKKDKRDKKKYKTKAEVSQDKTRIQ